MRYAPLLLAVLLIAAPASARWTVGAYRNWGAFCDRPRHCYAIGRPQGRDRKEAFVSVVFGPGAVQVALGRPAAAARMILGDASFPLAVEGSGAHAAPHDGPRIVTAMRNADLLIVEVRDAGGRRFRQHYDLSGAPSAIDAAALAALR